MTTTYTDQRRVCADDLYNRGGYYELVEIRVIDGVEKYVTVQALTKREALTIHLAPLQGLRHVVPGKQEE